MNTITAKGKDYELTDITFDVLSAACSASLSGKGFSNAEGGKVVFDALYIQNQGTLEEVQKDLKLYFGLCVKAFKLVDFEEADIKKKDDIIE